MYMTAVVHEERKMNFEVFDSEMQHEADPDSASENANCRPQENSVEKEGELATTVLLSVFHVLLVSGELKLRICFEECRNIRSTRISFVTIN